MGSEKYREEAGGQVSRVEWSVAGSGAGQGRAQSQVSKVLKEHTFSKSQGETELCKGASFWYGRCGQLLWGRVT